MSRLVPAPGRSAVEKARGPYLKALTALAKRKRGERLTDAEEVILAYTVYAGGCHACGSPKINHKKRTKGEKAWVREDSRTRADART